LQVTTIKKIDLKGKVLIESFPGVGMVGAIAANHISEQMDLEEISFIENDAFQPIAIFSDNDALHSVRIYGHENCPIVLFTSEFPLPRQTHLEVSNAIVDWCIKNKISEIVSLEGLTSNKRPEQHKSFLATTNSKIKETGMKIGLNNFKNGIVYGTSAMIYLKAKEKKLPSTVILTETEVRFPDARGAAHIINIINKLYSTKIDTAILINEAEKIEEKYLEIIKHLKQTPQAHENMYQ